MTVVRPQPNSRAEFLQYYDDSWSWLNSLVSQYDAEQMVVPADAAGWNVRDHLAHLCAWEATMIAFLRKEHQWDACGLTEAEYATGEYGEYDESNELIRQMTVNVSPADVLEMLHETNAEFLSTLASVPDADLFSKARDYHPDWAKKEKEYSVLYVIGGDTWSHFDEHYPWIERIVAG